MMRRIALVASALVLVGAAAAADLSGTVKFLTRRGQRPNVAETLVWLDSVAEASPREPGRFQILTRSKTLIPHVLAIPVDSTVEFPNADPISHNLFSLSGPNAFDLGFYRRGAGKARTFDKPGLVSVYCNVHPNMSAVIHVMRTPYFVFADAAGDFRFQDLPEGQYRVFAWNEVGGLDQAEVTISRGANPPPVDLTIDGRGFRQKPHLNKEGKPYQRSTGNDY